MQVGEPRPGLPEHGSRLRHHLRCPGFVHAPSLADHRDTCLLADTRALTAGTDGECTDLSRRYVPGSLKRSDHALRHRLATKALCEHLA